MRRLLQLVTALTLLAAVAIPAGTVVASTYSASVNLLVNGSFEEGSYSPTSSPNGWIPDAFASSGVLTWDNTQAHDGSKSVKITAPLPNDARWIQTVTVQPDTNYLLSGWIKTENVAHSIEAVDAGANLSILGTWTHTDGLIGTHDWTYVSMVFNSGPDTEIMIAPRLGYWSGTTTGTAWFDDLQLRRIDATDPHPRWKILVLIYGKTDFTYTDSAGIQHHDVAYMTWTEKERAELAATQFVETDIPALTSGNMIPSLTIRYPEQALTQLSPNGGGWWPAPENTASERDPAFDSVIVIWDPRVIDHNTGNLEWIGSAAGLTPAMGGGQTYTTLIVEAAIWYGHRNVFKHEWGHSILEYFNAVGTAPKPKVENHAEATQYVHCPTGQSYGWVDEILGNPIPNSIYNNDSGFTHDYYSGTTARASEPTHCLGITPEAWAAGGPVSKLVPPYQRIQALSAQVDQFVTAGVLSQGHGQALLAKLDAAAQALNGNRNNTAINTLHAFVNQVQAFVKTDHLTATDGQTLMDAADTTIAQLGP